MARTQTRSTQIADELTGQDIAPGSIGREQLNTTTSEGVVVRVLAGPGIALTSTGGLSGTGDVTVSLAAGDSVPTFIQPHAPNAGGPYLWWQTGLGKGGTGVTLWISDGG